MMRLNLQSILGSVTAPLVLSAIVFSSTVADGQVPQQHAAGQQQAANPTRVAAAGQAAPALPFAPLGAAEQASLNQLLQAWETQSKSTKTLECKFERWHFDPAGAPAGVHSEKATGVIKYASPDRGLFSAETLVFFNGINNGKPVYIAKRDANGKELPGEKWVCNGRELIEFDHTEKKCTVREMPPGMQGQEIFNSPLPFVFNLDAKQIQERYWVRQVPAPKPDLVLIEAWPKRAEDRAQYRLVQIALSKDTFLPQALLQYAPNFNAKTAPMWDHYEFSSVSRNGVGQRVNLFMRSFIPEQPPADWKVTRQPFQGPQPPAAGQQRAAAGQAPIQR